MDGVALRRLGQAELQVLAVEAVATVTHPVGPRREHLSAATVGALVGREAVEHRPVADVVGPHSRTHLGDDRDVVAARDPVLLTGR